MVTVVIPTDATEVQCPSCGVVLHNLAPLGVRHQVDCQCGADVVVERREADSTVHIDFDRRERQ